MLGELGGCEVDGSALGVVHVRLAIYIYMCVYVFIGDDESDRSEIASNDVRIASSTNPPASTWAARACSR